MPEIQKNLNKLLSIKKDGNETKQTLNNHHLYKIKIDFFKD